MNPAVKRKPGRPRQKFLEMNLGTYKDYNAYRKAMQKLYESNWSLVDDKKCSLFLILWASSYGLGGRTTQSSLTVSASNSEFRTKAQERNGDPKGRRLQIQFQIQWLQLLQKLFKQLLSYPENPPHLLRLAIMLTVKGNCLSAAW